MTNKQELTPAIIDLEASGFGRRSYPIEIGIALASGQTHCFLIKPHALWTYWDNNAERVHGISREILDSRGREIIEIATSLNELLYGQTIYSDGWGMDMSWLGKLYELAGIAQQFRLAQLQALFQPQQYERWHDTYKQLQNDLKLKRHRASADALLIQQTFIHTREQFDTKIKVAR